VPPSFTSSLAPVPDGVPTGPPADQAHGLTALARLVAAGARGEGCTDAFYPGVRYARYSAPSTFQKNHVSGPVLTVVAQGHKVARWGAAGELAFDPSHYLVITGEGAFEGRILDATPERPYLGVSVQLPSDLVAKVLLALADSGADAATETLPAFTAPLDPAIAETMLRFLRAVEDPIERRIMAPLVLEELVFRLLRSDAAAVVRSAVGQAPDAVQIQKAMQFMRGNATRPLTVGAVARHVGMSPSHFAHRFRAVARVSPMRYLKQLRMDRARALMLGDGVRVSEAAIRVGYESASHFTRDFKQTFGVAPAAYGRQFRRPG
jgi:AraC-like DNA-binding protein